MTCLMYTMCDIQLHYNMYVFIKNGTTSSAFSCLENPMDGGAWWAVVYGVAKSWTQLSN